MMNKFKSHARWLVFAGKNPGCAATILLATMHSASAQEATTVKNNAVQLVQDGADLLVAGAGCYGIWLGFRAARTLVAASREGGRGDNKGSHVMADLTGAAIAVSIGIVIYIVSNQLFGGASTQPTLTAPSMTPSGG